MSVPAVRMAKFRLLILMLEGALVASGDMESDIEV